MSLHDSDDYTRELIPSALKKDVKDAIETAVMMGWKMHISRDNAVTIMSPDDHKRYHFSVGSRSTHSMNRIHRDIFKYADPAKLQYADSLVGIRGTTTLDLAAGLLPRVGDPDTVIDHRPEIAAEQAEAEAQRAQAQREQEEQMRTQEKKRETTRRTRAAQAHGGPRPERSLVDGKHVVSEKPMLAAAGHHSAYDSKTTIERLWSDGSKDYKCTECDYSSTKSRGSVAAHYAKNHSVGLAPRPPIYQADVPDARKYAPRQYRVTGLAEAIKALLDSGETDPEVIARTALTWVHENVTPQEIDEDKPPATPEDLLNRIRSLLDDGTASQQRTMIDDLEARLVETEARAAEATEAAERAKATLKAFTDLATEFANEGQEATA